ncbi:hypothetical protein CesoFtcFv8_022617 [Champsocephalus esox]|uniref:G-protein coupled receptors family 1 profile domain-containing protein n=1 Tax=Champsocephalus esox TaxID=159716 RepID=A0AAN8B7T0_9TELE|nr:hypothetical protein CesoFtcFv8_022617 [Champsocephalus esox]
MEDEAARHDAPPLSVALKNSSSPCELPYGEARLPLLLLYTAVLTVGLPANLLTVGLTWLQVRRNNVLAVYLLSLSLCDLTYLSTLPLWAVYVSAGHCWPWSSLACKLTGYVFFTNMYISISLLCCVSCDRYVAVVFSLESIGLRRQRLAALLVLAVVLLVGAAHLPVFTMREGDAAEGERRCFEPSGAVTGFSYVRFLLGFLLPLLVLLGANRGVLSSVRHSTGLRRQQKQRVGRLAAAVVLLFLVCFGPYHVILLLRAAPPLRATPPLQACLMERRLYTSYIVALGLSTVNSAANPLLYVLSSTSIRRDLQCCLMQVCGRRRPNRDQNQNQIQIQIQMQMQDSLEPNTAMERVETLSRQTPSR